MEFKKKVIGSEGFTIENLAFIVPKVEIKQPMGDPSNPSEANEFNERVYSNSIDAGVLKIPCIAEESGIADHLKWKIGGTSTGANSLEWTPAYAGRGN